MKYIVLDPKLCPDACKDECMNGPRDVPGRRNKHKHNGYCYKWCSRTSNKNPKTHNGEVGYCGVSKAIKSDAVDCRGCYSKLSNTRFRYYLDTLRYYIEVVIDEI